jgi:hypothetical protein
MDAASKTVYSSKFSKNHQMGRTESNMDGSTSIYRKVIDKLGSIYNIFKQNICFYRKVAEFTEFKRFINKGDLD